MAGKRPAARGVSFWRALLLAVPVVVGGTWIFVSLNVAQVSAGGFFIRPATVRPMAPLITKPAMPEAGSVVAFESLAPLTGQHIDVATRHGTLRRGTLRLAGPVALELELDRAEGGVRLTMPADTITEIRYTPPATPAAPAAASDKAGTHAQEN